MCSSTGAANSNPSHPMPASSPLPTPQLCCSRSPWLSQLRGHNCPNQQPLTSAGWKTPSQEDHQHTTVHVFISTETQSEQGICGPSVVTHSCSTGLEVSGMRGNQRGGRIVSVCVVLEIRVLWCKTSLLEQSAGFNSADVGLKAGAASLLIIIKVDCRDYLKGTLDKFNSCCSELLWPTGPFWSELPQTNGIAS